MSRAYGIETKMKALVILSGGMDSATLLPYALSKHDKVHAITFDYGQKHDIEIKYAIKLIKHYNISHTIVKLNYASLLNTALNKKNDLEIPEKHESGIPATYVPFRNTTMLSISAGFAESWNFDTIYYGANAVDYSGYPDCRPDYVSHMNVIIKDHTDKIKIETPLISLTKAEIIQLGNSLKVPWQMTWSCYRGNKLACGKCPSCQYRLKGFKEAGLEDLLKYE
jgi:7-cyano-7-deazaguanine synthase